MKTVTYTRPDCLEGQKLEDDEIMICDNHNNFVHVINSTASIIWEMANGKHSTESIVKHFVEKYPQEEKDVIKSDVEGTLESMLKKGLLTPSE